MRALLVLLGCWAGWAGAQSPFASLWGPEWHAGPWSAPVPTQGVNSTAQEMLLGASEGGLIVGRMYVQFDARWWEQMAEWSPFAASRLGRPDAFDRMEPMAGWGLRAPRWPGLGEVMHLAYDEAHSRAVLAAYRDAKREDVDLFLVSMTREGWSEPRPIEGVNTAYNEVFPNWIGGRLVFGSDRPGGAGGFDLYATDRWSSFEGVERLGEPLNGPGDDVAAMGTEEGWYVCTARRGGQGGLDVWWVGRADAADPEVRAEGWSVRVVREGGGVWEGAELELRGADGGIWFREVQGVGRMALDAVPMRNQFSAVVNAAAAGRGFVEVWQGEALVLRLPMRSGVPFVLNLLALESIGESGWAAVEDASAWPAAFSRVQVLFGPDATRLDERGRGELERWWARWMDGEDGDIAGSVVVSGFADSVGTPGRNEAVSRLRAEAVRDWLVEQGVPAERIVLEAFAAGNPLSVRAWGEVARVQPVYREEIPCERRVEVRWGGW